MDKYRKLFPVTSNVDEKSKTINKLLELRNIARENNEPIEAAMIELRIIELKGLRKA